MSATRLYGTGRDVVYVTDVLPKPPDYQDRTARERVFRLSIDVGTAIDARDKVGIYASAHVKRRYGRTIDITYDDYDSSYDETLDLQTNAPRIAAAGTRYRTLDYPQMRYQPGQRVYAFRSETDFLPPGQANINDNGCIVGRWQAGVVSKTIHTVGREQFVVDFADGGGFRWYFFEHPDVIDRLKADRDMAKLYSSVLQPPPPVVVPVINNDDDDDGTDDDNEVPALSSPMPVVRPVMMSAPATVSASSMMVNDFRTFLQGVAGRQTVQPSSIVLPSWLNSMSRWIPSRPVPPSSSAEPPKPSK